MTMKRKRSPHPSAESTRNGRIALLIFALAIIVRLAYLGEMSKSPTFQVPIVDSQAYDQHARLLVTEGIFYQRFFWQGFFYPFFLAGVYLFTGGSMLWARCIQILLGSLLCVGVFRLGLRLFDRRSGAVAGMIAALYGPLIFFDAELLDTGFSGIWAVVLVLLVLRLMESMSLPLGLFFGICGGVSVVTRATFLPFLVVVCIWLLAAWRKAGASLRRLAAGALVMLAGFLLVALPVAQLCYQATGDFNFLSESGPINLFIGNNPERDRTIMIRPGAEWRELTRMPMVSGSPSDSADRGAFSHLFLDYVRTRPGDFAKGLVEKTVQFFSSRELPRNDDLYVGRKYSKLFSVLTWKAGKFGFPFGLLLGLAIVGIVRYSRRIPVPVYLFLILYPAAVIGVFVSGRYRIPIVPVLAVPAAAGALCAFDSLKQKRWLRLFLIAGGIGAVAAASSIAGPFAVERFDYEAEMHTIVGFELMKQNRTQEALAELSEALRLDPENGDAHKFIGLLMSQERRHAEAAVHLRKALEQAPDSYLIRYYLAMTLLNLGERNEAIRYLEEARSGALAAREEELIKEIDKALGSLAQRQRSGDSR